MLRAEIVTAESRQWARELDRTRYDVYQTPGWAIASAHNDGGEPLAAISASDDRLCIIPFLKRDIDGRDWDATSPYGYGGPIWSDSADPGWRTDAVIAAATALRDSGAVSWFLRLHPLLPEVRFPASIKTVEHGATVSIDVTMSPGDRWQKTRSGHRTDILRARRAGMEVTFIRAPSELASFARLYRDTMRRIGASPYYMFDDGYFGTLLSELRQSLLLATARLDGTLIGGGLFLLAPQCGIINYHLSAAATLRGNLQPTKLILSAVQEWAASHGYTTVHLGGGLGGSEDSLFRFKAGFSPLRHRFSTARFILDQGRYRALTGSGVGSTDFFPEYRAGTTGGDR